MGRFGRAGRFAAPGAALVLAACSSLGNIAPATTAGSDPASPDLAAAVFAVDMPDSVEPGAAPRITYGVALDVALVPADFEAVMPVLPPPAEGRSYAVYAFSSADQAKVRAALAAPAGATLVVAPRVCVTADTRRQTDSVTVLAIVPGRRPVVVAGPETLVALEARTGIRLAACSGHSG